MTNTAFTAVLVLVVLVIIILIVGTAWLITRRKCRNRKPQDPESARIGQEHVEFPNNFVLQRMQAPRQPTTLRGSLDITTQGSAQPRHGTQSQTPGNPRPAPRSSLEQWRRRGFEFTPPAPATIPEEADVGQQRADPRQGHMSPTPIADSFLRRSRIGVAQTTPYEEAAKARMSLNGQQPRSSPYVEDPKPKLSVNTQHPRHARVEDAPEQTTSAARKSSKFQEHLESPENEWQDVPLSPPLRQSVQSNPSSGRNSFESNLPASWGKPVSSNRFPLD